MSLREKVGRLEAAIMTTFMSVLGGAWVLLTGMLDPSWLVGHTGSWFGIASLTTRFVGPQILPEIPWSLLTLVAALVFIGASLYRLDKQGKLSNK